MLKYHGKYSLFETLEMTFSEQDWHLERLLKQFKDDAKAQKTK